MLVGATLLACGACAGEPEAPPPNLLLITIDTLRADRLSCYGGETGVGDAICRIADTGTRYIWAFSTAPYTAPSIASVLTSQYAFEHGVRESAVSYLADDAISVAEVLKARGYTTAAFVSNPVLDRSRQLTQGFDVYDQRMTRRERNRKGFAEREAKATTDAAVAWAEVGAEQPWFLWVHFQDPHGPYEPPDPASPRTEAANSTVLAPLSDDSGFGGIPSYQRLPRIFDFQSYSQRYTDEIQYLDPHVGRLVDRLDELGRPPAVLLTSDHGEAFGEDDYYFAHGHSVGLDQIRVPLLWRPPVPGPPGVWDSPVSTIDIAPTLLRIAGLELPDSYRGVVLPTTSGTGSTNRPIFAEHNRRAAVIVGRTYYARDRETVLPGTLDRMSGGSLRSLPARTAELTVGGDPTPYRLGFALPGSNRGSSLEDLLAGFIDRGKVSAAGAAHDSTDPEQRERLRALGYAD
jgi:arylsulfatase A-like enzyme